MKDVKIYTKDYCPYCVRAKNLFKSKGVPYEEINVEADEGLFEDLKKRTGLRTVPQIFIGETLVGGFSDLQALDEAGKLQPLLER